MKYSKRSECASFLSWFYFSGDWRHHWDGPYILWRERFYRICGFEFSWFYIQEDQYQSPIAFKSGFDTLIP